MTGASLVVSANLRHTAPAAAVGRATWPPEPGRWLLFPRPRESTIERMAKRWRRRNRSDEEIIRDLEARIEQLRGLVGTFKPEKVLAERDRLEVSAADYAALVGVSSATIYGWEKGKTRPRAKQLAQWEAVLGIGKREAWRRLGLIE